MQKNMDLPTRPPRFAKAMLALGLAYLLVGCAQTPRQPAPHEERNLGLKTPAPANAASAPASKLPDPANLPGAENVGKPGYYTVKPRDTLIQIALDNGQNWRDLARWNNLGNANLIEVGQVLQVLPLASTSPLGPRPVVSAKVEAPRALGSALPAASAASGAASAAAVPPVVVNAARDGDDDPSWGWPAAAPVSAGFDEQRNKGLAFSGKLGDAVLAAADGRVIYAGSGVRGYGNLIIIKHNANYLTAYAHNQALLVKEDQAVRRGQRIAEMGNSDADQVKLHFEVRKQGKPVDPTKLLPTR